MGIGKYVIRILSALSLCLLLSCSEEHSLEELERIKTMGDENPYKALSMLDSLEIGIREESDYVKNKYDLLRIRLNDKADNMPSSDIMIKRLVGYFEDKGSVLEKQEVCYYAGSVYRDLQDTPRSLEYFLKSIEYTKNGNDRDSIMLRNAYSNLNDLYYKVQNYNDAVKMAQKELEIAKQMKTDAIIPYLHIGTAYLALKHTKEACAAFDAALEEITHSKDVSKHQDELLYLLCDYSVLKQHSNAKKCFSLIENDPLKDFSDFPCMAFAQYYELYNRTDSAIIYSKLLLDKGNDIYNMYDASKFLYRIYSMTGDVNNSSHYAGIYMQLSDSLDFGKRQELTATVNNAHKYHLDEKKEQELKAGKELYRLYLLFALLSFVVIGVALCLLYIRRRNIQMKRIIELSSELERLSADDKYLREEIANKVMELKVSKRQLEKSNEELIQVKRELSRINSEYNEYDIALKEKERQLSEKMEQNKTFIKLLHQSELEGKAEDVILAIRQSTTGKKNMTSADWKQLYQAVDELYPNFKDKLLKELGTFTEQQMQVCYLMRIGLSKPQIQNMTNLSRVTVWRWVKKYDWVLTSNDR